MFMIYICETIRECEMNRIKDHNFVINNVRYGEIIEN